MLSVTPITAQFYMAKRNWADYNSFVTLNDRNLFFIIVN